jgi:hypothetical protein
MKIYMRWLCLWLKQLFFEIDSVVSRVQKETQSRKKLTVKKLLSCGDFVSGIK